MRTIHTSLTTLPTGKPMEIRLERDKGLDYLSILYRESLIVRVRIGPARLRVMANDLEKDTKP